MATEHKKLASGQLAASAGNIYAPTVKGMVKTIALHNTGSATKHATVYFGTTANAADKILRVSLEGYETLEWGLQHMLVVDGSSSSGIKLSGEAESATTINYFIFGAEES
jgi:hypothetical protein